MAILSRLLWEAVRRVASDSRVQAKAAEVLATEVKPRAEAAWRQAKPKLDAAKAKLRDAAREANPREHPRKFAAKVKERFLGRK